MADLAREKGRTERYLPKAAWAAMSAEERRATDEKKKEASDPYQEIEKKDTMTEISKLMSSLPEKQRQVMQLRDIEGYSYKEITDILEIDMNQVKVNLFRARKEIKEKLLNINAYGL